MNIASLYSKLDGLLATLAGWLRPLFLLVIRLYWGWSFFQTGKGKLMHLDRTTNFFAGLNIPAPKVNAILAGTTECVGGLLLLVGLGGRVVPVPLLFVLIMAYLTADSEALHSIFSDPDKFTGATPFLFLFAVLTIFIFGPGPISLDAVFRKSSSDK